MPAAGAYDVAVIGAGPAGTSFCAEYLRQRPDDRVLLLEGIRRPNTLTPEAPGAGHSMCSGGLGRYMAELIGRIPREVVMADVHRAILRSPNETVEITAELVHATGPIGLVLDRRKWDDWLLGQAVEAGAEYVNGARVSHVIRENAQEWSVNTSAGVFRARFLVGADGPESLVAEACLDAPPIPEQDMFLASEVYVPAPNFHRDAILLEFRTSRLAGYYWAFSAGAVVKVGCGTTRASGTNPGVETAWWRQRLADEYHEPGFTSKPSASVGGRITGSAPLRVVVDPMRSVAVAGEAARAVWASVGAGDASAVETGRHLATALANGHPEQYQAWWDADARRWLTRHYRIKNLLLGMTDAQLDRALHAVSTYRPRTTNTRREVPRLILHLALHEPSLLAGGARAMLG